MRFELRYEELTVLFHCDVKHFVDVKNPIGIQVALFTDNLQFKKMLILQLSSSLM